MRKPTLAKAIARGAPCARQALSLPGDILPNGLRARRSPGNLLVHPDFAYTEGGIVAVGL
jgi:hypothetical protein